MYIKRGYITDGTGIWYSGKQLEPYSKCRNEFYITIKGKIKIIYLC